MDPSELYLILNTHLLPNNLIGAASKINSKFDYNEELKTPFALPNTTLD